MSASTTEVLNQIERSGYGRYLIVTGGTSGSITGLFDLDALPTLAGDGNFAHGILYGLHTNVGHDLMDFRSYRGAFGKGSLQLVIDQKTGECYADVDVFNIYEDLIGVVGHSVIEVVPHLFRSAWRKLKGISL